VKLIPDADNAIMLTVHLSSGATIKACFTQRRTYREMGPRNTMAVILDVLQNVDHFLTDPDSGQLLSLSSDERETRIPIKDIVAFCYHQTYRFPPKDYPQYQAATLIANSTTAPAWTR
jgi:hypothetical protein